MTPGTFFHTIGKEPLDKKPSSTVKVYLVKMSQQRSHTGYQVAWRRIGRDEGTGSRLSSQGLLPKIMLLNKYPGIW